MSNNFRQIGRKHEILEEKIHTVYNMHIIYSIQYTYMQQFQGFKSSIPKKALYRSVYSNYVEHYIYNVCMHTIYCILYVYYSYTVHSPAGLFNLNQNS